jgi:hypothetical protein|tara:strand:- start:66 stop:233 length:168 start_codon:yes stop_codon:yes gene_type:complete
MKDFISRWGIGIAISGTVIILSGFGVRCSYDYMTGEPGVSANPVEVVETFKGDKE